MDEPHEHDRPLNFGRAGGDTTPQTLPYRSDLLASLSAIINRVNSPQFQTALAIGAGLEIDQQAGFALRHLGFRGAMRPSQLAHELGTGRSNVSKIIARLETEALVERAPDPADSRATLLVLTELGRITARRTFEIGDEMIAAVTMDWTEAEIASYESLTSRLSQSLAEYAEKVID